MGSVSPPATPTRRQDLAAAARYTVPVAMGYLPLGVAYGILLTTNGIPWYWAPLSSLVIFAGSMQYLSVSLLAGLTALPQVALATFAVNFRHVFYGLSFPLHRLAGRAQRCYGVFALTDETYSIITTRNDDELTSRRITIVQLLSHSYWIISSTLGAVAAFAMPRGIRGLDFALTALFVVLAYEAVREKRNYRAAAVGLASSAIAVAVTPSNFLTVAIAALVAALIAAHGWKSAAGRRGAR